MFIQERNRLEMGFKLCLISCSSLVTEVIFRTLYSSQAFLRSQWTESLPRFHCLASFSPISHSQSVNSSDQSRPRTSFQDRFATGICACSYYGEYLHTRSKGNCGRLQPGESLGETGEKDGKSPRKCRGRIKARQVAALSAAN